MASHQLIDSYVIELADRLPAQIVDEVADGLTETWHHHLTRGLAPAAAARTAIAEFGTPAQVVDAFVDQAAGRRTARALLATGPIVGACWAASLLTARAWTWPVPPAGAVTFAATLVTVVCCLAAAATSRHSYQRTRLGTVGAASLVALDVAMLAVVLLSAPALVWPMAAAIPASLVRIGLTLRRLPARR
ncbi:MAG TPA: hypothetical protein VFM54_00620 [Micromonosporaceae bacterium]|nr:hypothetical protein [Micromonosporaceae bacterium]